MLAPFDGPEGLEAILDDARKNAVALGPGAGVGGATKALALVALQHKNAPAVVLDADALTSFADDVSSLRKAVSLQERPVVLTPHEGEFARLFADLPGCNAEDGGLPPSRYSRALAAARHCGAIVCLKGPDTIVVGPDGRRTILRAASPWLATAGSGDVLTGMITGLLAQKMPAFEAVSAAVWMHAEAARLFGPGLIAEDIAAALPQVWQSLVRSGQC